MILINPTHVLCVHTDVIFAMILLNVTGLLTVTII